MCFFFLLHFCYRKLGTNQKVDLYGAHIEWAKEKSSRKNVFQVRRLHTFKLFLFFLNLAFDNQNKTTLLSCFHELELVVFKLASLPVKFWLLFFPGDCCYLNTNVYCVIINYIPKVILTLTVYLIAVWDSNLECLAYIDLV